jgi:hypothetical protein
MKFIPLLILWNFVSVDMVVQMKFLNIQVTPAMWENYVRHTEKLMKESWEAETSIENREPVDPLIISLEETSEKEND